MTAVEDQDTTAPGTAAVADAAVRLAGHALAFGRVERTACLHPDGTPESDTDHTVALGWLAAALAAAIAPGLDAHLVASFALVHDAVETFAGDTPTLRISGQGRADKAAREQAAVRRWQAELGQVLPWLPGMIVRYEAQDCPEARWVRAVDKICPKLLHVLSRAEDLAGYGMTTGELSGMLARQRAEISGYAGDFGLLMALYDEMAGRALRALELKEREANAHKAGTPIKTRILDLISIISLPSHRRERPGAGSERRTCR